MTPASRPIRLLLNGAPVDVIDTDPATTLLAWLREVRRCTGTKEGCAEGDCGACTVVIGERVEGEAADGVAPDGDGLQLRPVNACLQLLAMLDGKAVFTVESLRRPDGSLHPVQQAMVDHHGSQCGFCTPGFVMSLWGAYAEHAAAGTRPDRNELAARLTGNLCRCTGYRPIIDAGEAAYDLPAVAFDHRALAAALRARQSPEPLVINGADGCWHAPRTLDQLLALRAAYPQATVLAGGTDIGVWLNKQAWEAGDLIYLGAVAELQRIAYTDDRLTIGAGVSLSDAYRAIQAHYPAIDEVADRFASLPIRNAGTLGGNIANGSPIGDSMPWLIALGARVELACRRARRWLPLEALYIDYRQTAMQPDEVVTAVDLPLPAVGQVFRVYKLAKRYDSDISAVCAAFALQLDGGRLGGARVAFGGLAATPRRAPACEAALIGQPWNEHTVQQAMQALTGDFTPLDDLRASAAYRLRTARNLLYRCFVETRPDDALPRHLTRVSPDRMMTE